MSTTSAKPEITLHWLTSSRATRVLWLLELLNLDYEIKVYKRDEGLRAPPELKKVHPLGKAPVLEVNGLQLVESGLIFQYLLKNFDADHRLSVDSEADQILLDYYLHYSEGTLQPNLVAILVLNASKERVPWTIRGVGGKVLDAVSDRFFLKEVELNMEYLNAQLKGRSYFVGDKLSGADIMLSFPVGSIIQGKRVKLDLSHYPNVTRWFDTIRKDPNYIKADKIREKYE